MTSSPRLIASSSQTVGPFFHFGLATNPALAHMVPADAPGERVRVRVRVTDGDQLPVIDALIELFQADAAGEPARPGFSGFGRLATDENGACVFETVRPGAVRDTAGTVHAPHIDVCLFARGLLRHLHTRLYFSGDPALANDPTLALVPVERRATLLASPAAGEAGVWEFAIRLQGDGETVFFDL